MRIILATIAFAMIASSSWSGDKLSIGNYSCILKGEAQIFPDRVQSEQFKSPEPFGLEAFKEEIIIFNDGLGYPDDLILNKGLFEGEYTYSNDYPAEVQFYVRGNQADFILEIFVDYYFLFGTCNKI
jgi:hypothetical protein